MQQRRRQRIVLRRTRHLLGKGTLRQRHSSSGSHRNPLWRAVVDHPPVVLARAWQIGQQERAALGTTDEHVSTRRAGQRQH